MKSIRLSRRIEGLAPSPTLSIKGKAQDLKRRGTDVIDLGIGELDFLIPEHVKRAGISAINGNFSRYTDPSGIPELKETISGTYGSVMQLQWNNYRKG